MNTYQLKEYYIAYLEEVRHVSKASVVHYTQAIDRVSKYLISKNLIEESLFEIYSVEKIEEIKLFLITEYKPGFFEFNPIELKELDKRGNRMYINGFMHFYNFAIGYNFAKKRQIILLDKPMKTTKNITIIVSSRQRNSIFKKQVIEAADHTCEINGSHYTFDSKSTNKPYMEAHHLIPISHQKQFGETSLDVYANIMCLCPNCHRFLHYGKDEEKINTLKIIFSKRADRLWKSGIKIDENQFINSSIK